MKGGIVIVNKEEGLTSQAVVNRVKRIFGVSKAGHTGTLDPLATGVLPVLIERGVKASEYMLSSDKHYIATLKLGMTTDTEDITGEVLTITDALPSDERVIAAAGSFVGEYMQTPPMYSALKVGGKKLCDLARAGVEIDREPRGVTIHSLITTPLCGGEYTLEVICSKGTYIRTLCADIGARLGVGGVMKTLCRASAAGFTLEKGHTLSELEGMSEEEKKECIIPIERIFEHLPAVFLPPFFEKLAHSGLEIYQKKISTDFALGQRVRIMGADGFFALGEVMEFEDGEAIKPIKQFF
jgi:tRNA pseudouridine55 synthase